MPQDEHPDLTKAEAEIMDLERRKYKEMRERFNRLDQRYRRLVIGVIVMGVIFGAISTASLFSGAVILNERSKDAKQAKTQATRIQQQRFEQARLACDRSNRTNGAIRSVLLQFPQVPAFQINKFPIIPDCRRYARSVTGDEPMVTGPTGPLGARRQP